MAISPPSSAKTHSLVSVLCFFFCVLCFVVLICSSSSAQFCISSLVSSNPTISHKRELEICSFSTVSLDVQRFGMALLDVSTNISLLYKEEFDPSHSKISVDFAVSREQTNEKGEKMYIQTRMAKYAEELWELLKKKDNTFVYMCGLKGMEKGIYEIMISLAAKDGKQGTFNSFHFFLGGEGGEPTKSLLYMVVGFETRIDWLEYKKQLKRSEQRNVEVY
ncbi:hypothetical protein DY000_02055643 [Brassica cretica]|uniref:Oxidoreductase FAD/NAD(P)-binding domain-containing protein n=1 Tax=Brassica cretica TaxID=69181 RepID=A0ABQ7ADR2_BRACR|nr:hypothetical protein DY000_02055643 [Brassica cretica]